MDDTDLTLKKKLDGLVILSKTLRVVKPISNVYIRFPILTKKCRVSKLLKGSRLFQKCRNVYTTRLFESNGFTIFITCCGCNEAMESEQNDIFKESVIGTLQELFRIGRQTGMSYNLRANNPSKNESDMIVVYIEDLDKFSEILYSKLGTRDGIHEWSNPGDPLQYFLFLSMATGQSYDFQKYIIKMQHCVDVSVAEETIVHVAWDYELDNSYLTWRLDKLTEIMGARPNWEYFPDCLAGVGGFYYFLPNQELEARAITLFKAYTEGHKYVHLNSPQPFRFPSISELIWEFSCQSFGGITIARKREILSLLAQAEKRLELGTRLATSVGVSYSAARAEFVVSMLAGSTLHNADLEVTRFVQQKSHIQALTSLDMDTIKHRRKRYMIPAIEELKTYIRGCTNLLNGVHLQSFKFRPDDRITMMACEAILSFFIYGTASATSTDKGHPYSLCKDLHLLAKYFRNTGLEFTYRTPFKELTLKATNIEAGNMWALKFHLGFQYRPEFDTVSVLNDFQIAGSVNYENLVSLIGDYVISQQGNELCSTLIALVLHSASANLGGRRRRFAKGCVERYSATCRHDTPTSFMMLKSANEFINWLYGPRQNGDMDWGLQFVLDITKWRLGEHIGNFKDYLAEYLNTDLKRMKSCFVFPFGPDKRQMVVNCTLLDDGHEGIYFIEFPLMKKYPKLKVAKEQLSDIVTLLKSQPSLRDLDMDCFLHKISLQLRIFKKIDLTELSDIFFKS